MPRFDKLIVLDLDETLVHSRTTPLERAPDFWWAGHACYRRPHAAEFFKRCTEWFHVGIWTAADTAYAMPVLERTLRHTPQSLEFLMTADHCEKEENGLVIKDIRKILAKGWAPERVLMIDNHPSTFSRNPQNGLAIKDYTGALDDAELLTLLDFLEGIGGTPDLTQIDTMSWSAAGS